MTLMGMCHAIGRDVEQDDALAAEWFRKAADGEFQRWPFDRLQREAPRCKSFPYARTCTRFSLPNSPFTTLHPLSFSLPLSFTPGGHKNVSRWQS